MKYIFLKVENKEGEIQMGQKLNFSSEDMSIDGLSASANSSGFTPLTAIARKYNWNSSLISSAVEECNRRNEIAVIGNIKPLLFLVPRTKGDGDTSYLISDLCSAIINTKIKSLRFTHYCFIQDKFPKSEISAILSCLNESEIANHLDVIYWDIDKRHIESMRELFETICNSDFVLSE